MDLLLWRHAEAVEGDPDLQRKLTVRGDKQARQMADWIRANAPAPMRVLASPALRTQQTAEALKLPFTSDSRLGPTANVPDLLAAIGWPDGDGLATEQVRPGHRKSRKSHPENQVDASASRHPRAVLVVGHQPALGRLAALLLAGQEADWSIKKGALWWFSNRIRQGETQTVLRAVISCSLLPQPAEN